MTTPEEQRARLAGRYSGMSDEELREIALSGDQLTSVAQELFEREIARRGLDLTSPGTDESAESDPPEVVAPFSDMEHQRVAELYSSKSDGELEKLAADGFELSDEAREALQAEIGRRGLNLALAPPPGIDVYEVDDKVTLRKFRDLPEALLAKGSLESAGIGAYLLDDNMIRMDWFISNLLGGIKLQVRAEDAEAAEEILSQPILETLEVDGVGNYEQPKCPHCHSLDIGYQELNKLASYGSAYVGLPIPVQKKTWTCHVCGNEWVPTADDLPSGKPIDP
jgi:Putative prokaryotic signal transducing protein